MKIVKNSAYSDLFLIASKDVSSDGNKVSSDKEEFTDEPLKRIYVKWLKSDNSFQPVGDVKVVDELTRSAYRVRIDPYKGLFFDREKPKTAELYKFKSGPMEEVLSEIDKFWSLKKDYEKLGLLYCRGILLYGPPGCHAAGTKIVMFDGSLKNVEDIREGDLLMGPDSTSRTVMALCRGIDEMYEITPVFGNSFVVNGNHDLHLHSSRINNKPIYEDIKVNDYLASSSYHRSRYTLVKASVEFSNNGTLPIDPYVLGLWLGDGTSSKPEFTTADKEIVDAIENEAKNRNLLVRIHKQKDNKSSIYSLTTGFLGAVNGSKWKNTENRNSFANDLKRLNVLNNKHIPECYLTSSRKDRMALLAGLIDTDGNLSNNIYYDITQKNSQLSQDIERLCLSLGFRVSLKKCKRSIKSINFTAEYNRLSISGTIENIPVRIARKKKTTISCKNSLHVGIRSVRSLGLGKYYGFQLSGDHKYMTGDFFIQNNSGKTSIIHQVVDMITKRGDIVVYSNDVYAVREGLKSLRSVEPDRKLVVVLEDADEQIRYNEQQFLHLLDGQDSQDGVLYLATTNYIDRFPARLLRSGRFDKKVEVPQPPKEGRETYLKNKLLPHKMETEKEIERLAEETDGMSFGDLLELVTAVYALKEPVDKVLARLRVSAGLEEKIQKRDESLLTVPSVSSSPPVMMPEMMEKRLAILPAGDSVGAGRNIGAGIDLDFLKKELLKQKGS